MKQTYNNDQKYQYLWGITINNISNNNIIQQGFLANTEHYLEHKDSERLILENLVTTVWKDELAITEFSFPLEQQFSPIGHKPFREQITVTTELGQGFKPKAVTHNRH